MEIADRIALLNHGAIEQVGPPRELYDRPANEFVMTFVGEANRVGGALVRPHDVELLDEHDEGTSEAMIVRVTVLGRDVKVELHDGAGAEIVALLTRERYEQLQLWRGQTVWIRPRAEHVFTAR